MCDHIVLKNTAAPDQILVLVQVADWKFSLERVLSKQQCLKNTELLYTNLKCVWSKDKGRYAGTSDLLLTLILFVLL